MRQCDLQYGEQAQEACLHSLQVPLQSLLPREVHRSDQGHRSLQQRRYRPLCSLLLQERILLPMLCSPHGGVRLSQAQLHHKACVRLSDLQLYLKAPFFRLQQQSRLFHRRSFLFLKSSFYYPLFFVNIRISCP